MPMLSKRSDFRRVDKADLEPAVSVEVCSTCPCAMASCATAHVRSGFRVLNLDFAGATSIDLLAATVPPPAAAGGTARGRVRWLGTTTATADVRR